MPDHPSLVTTAGASAQYLSRVATPNWRRAAQSQKRMHDLSQWASQQFIQAMTGYYFGKSLTEVQTGLRDAAIRYAEALAAGERPHAWEIEHRLLLAIAIDAAPLAEAIVALKREEWDTARIRPVNWLVTRIRLTMDLWRGEERDLTALVENSRIGLFVDQLPSELAPDLPLMRNIHHLLAAVVARDAPAFAQHLEERLRVRTDHFSAGGGIAPTSLMDLQALAYLRLARLRGMTVAPPAHVWLPDLPA
jgi:hypothetical protein